MADKPRRGYAGQRREMKRDFNAGERKTVYAGPKCHRYFLCSAGHRFPVFADEAQKDPTSLPNVNRAG